MCIKTNLNKISPWGQLRQKQANKPERWISKSQWTSPLRLTRWTSPLLCFQSRTVIKVCPFFSRRYNRLAREWTQKYAMWECLRLKKTTESNGQRNTFLLVTRGVKISECWGEGTTKQQTLGRESESGGESHYELNPLSCAVLLNPPSERISLENSRKTVKPDKPRGTTTQEVRLVLLLVLLLLSLWFFSVLLVIIVCHCDVLPNKETLGWSWKAGDNTLDHVWAVSQSLWKPLLREYANSTHFSIFKPFAIECKKKTFFGCQKSVV